MENFAEVFKHEIIADFEAHLTKGSFDDVFVEIIRLSQEIESKLKRLLLNPVYLHKKSSGKLLERVRELNIFTDRNIDTLQHIIDLRNWVFHLCFLDYPTLNADENKRLVETKHLMYEVVDFIDNYFDRLKNPAAELRPTII
jgi:hypothetical protein